MQAATLLNPPCALAMDSVPAQHGEKTAGPISAMTIGRITFGKLPDSVVASGKGIICLGDVGITDVEHRRTHADAPAPR